MGLTIFFSAVGEHISGWVGGWVDGVGRVVWVGWCGSGELGGSPWVDEIKNIYKLSHKTNPLLKN